MYARLQTVDLAQIEQAIPAGVDPDAFRSRMVETVAGHPGFAGLYQLTDSDTATLLTLWQTEEDARRASERTAAQLGPRPLTLVTDDVYEVTATWGGTAEGEPAGAAVVMHFDGPVSQERLDAAEFAGRERIEPALRTVTGLVGGYLLWHAERRAQVMCTLATSNEALGRMEQTVMSTELLPGEDPDLLPGPDRLALHQVIDQRIPAPAEH